MSLECVSIFKAFAALIARIFLQKHENVLVKTKSYQSNSILTFLAAAALETAAAVAGGGSASRITTSSSSVCIGSSPAALAFSSSAIRVRKKSISATLKRSNKSGKQNKRKTRTHQRLTSFATAAALVWRGSVHFACSKTRKSCKDEQFKSQQAIREHIAKTNQTVLYERVNAQPIKENGTMLYERE